MPQPNIKIQPSANDTEPRLRINEIFFSLQGETSRIGLPTVFIRLTGCPLRCGYCDTAYAFHEGTTQTFDDIFEKVDAHQAKFITVTGGEPLAQKDCLKLLTSLCDKGYSVSLETSGALDITNVDKRVSRIVDIKTPGSEEVEKNRWENIQHLNPHDEVKFVICDRHDYEWAKDVMKQYDLTSRCPVLFSPIHKMLEAKILAEWILQDRLDVRMQVQLHKYLWGDVPGH